MLQRRHFIGAAGAMAGVPLWGQAQAQAPYPAGPVRVLQGFAPGGNADTIARLIGNELSRTLGQVFNIDAQPGAGGTLAAGTVARAKPDGQTLLLATGGHAVAAALYNNLPYASVAAFECVCTITFFPFLWVTQSDSKFKNLRELLAAARVGKDAVAYGTAGVGSTHHLVGDLMSRMAGVQMLHVPYRGDAASLTSLLAGDVPVIIAPPTAVLSHIKSGKLRPLATTGARRWPGLPDLPTVAEQGVAGYDVSSWAGLMAPAGTPRPVVDKLNAETLKALQLPAVKARLEEMGGEARGSTPEEMRAMLASEVERWTKLVAEANIPRQ
jgi:tripartite-type tricarboxylate transporter receptor subunit TctC